jgi:hypothetical protein
MSQQGLLSRLKRTGREGEPLWAYPYRMGGPGPTTHTSRRTKTETAAATSPGRTAASALHLLRVAGGDSRLGLGASRRR